MSPPCRLNLIRHKTLDLKKSSVKRNNLVFNCGLMGMGFPILKIIKYWYCAIDYTTLV